MAGITGFKVALCLSYLRILSQHTLNYRKIVWVVLVTCALSHLAGTLVLIFQCKPVQKSWLPRTEGTCLRNDITFYVLAAITILFDCIIFVLPIPILVGLQINKRRKAGLLCVFMLGIFTTVCSVMRMVQIITISATGNSTMLVLWGTIELNVGVSPVLLPRSVSSFASSYIMAVANTTLQILLTCIPTLTPLFTYFREKSSRHGYYSNNRSNNHSVPLKPRGPVSRLASHNAEPWKESRLDRDSDDNDSQRKIVRDETGTTTMAYPGTPGWDGKGFGAKHVKGSPSEEGIRATTTVTVEVAEESKSLSSGGSVRGRNEKWRGAP